MRNAHKSALIGMLLLGVLGLPGGVAGWGFGQEGSEEILINIPSRTLELWENGHRLRSYPVGVGRPGFPTPLGEFKVTRLITNPGWEHPYQKAGASRIAASRNNPLGTRWIGFHPYKGGEYGIHGTNNPGSVGKFSSHGCVRMKIADAEDLFSRVHVGTPVRVVYETVRLSRKNNGYYVTVYPDTYRKKVDVVGVLKTVVSREFPDLQIRPDSAAGVLQKAQPGQPVRADMIFVSEQAESD